MNGNKFYDQYDVFDNYYSNISNNENNANLTLERPLLLELIGQYSSNRILDLGCGFGHILEDINSEFIKSYTGIDPSAKMIHKASTLYNADNIKFIKSDFKEFDAETKKYDLIISSLVFHYIDDFNFILEKCSDLLAKNGLLVFTVLHPIITGSSMISKKLYPKHSNWLIDNYYLRGKKEAIWFDNLVEQYHRTIGDYFNSILKSNFDILEVKEPEPNPKIITDNNTLEYRQKLPLFLGFKLKLK